MNIVEFALRFKDMASSELGRFGNTARATFANASNFANNLTGRNRVLGQSFEQLQAQIRAVENTIRTSTIPSQISAARRELAALQRQATTHRGNTTNISSGGGSAATGGLLAAGLSRFVGPAAIAGAVVAAGAFFGNTFNKALERQQIQTSFNVLAGDKGAGEDLTKQLVKYQKDTILGPEVFKNAQTMMGFGFKSADVMPNMKMLGDVSMGNAEKLGSLTLAFSQTKAAGRLMGQDLLQYVSAGFNPLEQMSKRTGMSIGVLRKEMEKGNISFEMVQQAFKDATSEGGKFNNMLAEIAKTPAGKAQALAGAWNEFKVNTGTAFMPLISLALDFGSKMLPMIEKLLTPLANGVTYIIDLFSKNKNAILDYFAPYVSVFDVIVKNTANWLDYWNVLKLLFMDHIMPMIQKVGGIIWNMVGSIITFIANSEIVKDIFRVICQFVGWIFDLIGWVAEKMKWIFDNIVLPIYNAIEKAYKWIKGMSGTEVKITSTAKINNPIPPTPKAPSTNPELIKSNTSLATANTTTAASNEAAVSGGGPKTINITVQKFLDSININTTTLAEGESDIEKRILEMFARIVAQGAQAM